MERGLLEHIRAFLLEMGAGFAFVGSQYHLEVGDADYYIDLLFYHLAALYHRRPQNGQVPAGIRGKDELLPVSH